jgi:hypothetical protein
MANKRTRKPHNPTDWHGPRVVGGVYRCAYWGDTYTVIRADAATMTVQWSDGHKTTHCTAWERRDSVVSQP